MTTLPNRGLVDSIFPLKIDDAQGRTESVGGMVRWSRDGTRTGVTRSGDLAQSSFYLALTDPRSLGLEIAGLEMVS